MTTPPPVAHIPLLSVHTDRVPNLRFTAPGDSAEGETRSPVEIAKSIAARGQDTPIEVTTNDGGITYDVIDGHTRVAAFRILAGLTLPDVPDPDWPKADPRRFAHIEARVFPPMSAAEVQYEALVRGSVRNPYTTADVAYRVGEILRGPLRRPVHQLGRDLGVPSGSIHAMAVLSGIGTHQAKPAFGLSPRVWEAWRRPRPGRPVGLTEMANIAIEPYGGQWDMWTALVPEDGGERAPSPEPRADSRIQKNAANYARIVLELVELGMLADDRDALAEIGVRLQYRRKPADKALALRVYRSALGLQEGQEAPERVGADSSDGAVSE